MKSELIVDAQPAEVSIALLEDGRLVSLQKEARNIAYAVGDIYLAKLSEETHAGPQCRIHKRGV